MSQDVRRGIHGPPEPLLAVRLQLKLHSLKGSGDERRNRPANGAGERDPRIEAVRACGAARDRRIRGVAGRRGRLGAARAWEAREGERQETGGGKRAVESVWYPESLPRSSIPREVEAVENRERNERRSRAGEEPAHSLVAYNASHS